MTVKYFVVDNLSRESQQMPDEFVDDIEEMIRQTLLESHEGEYTEEQLASMVRTFSNVIPNKINSGFLAYAESEDGKVVGFGLANLYKGTRPELQNFYVKKEFQGQGIGKELYRLCEEKLREMGGKFIFLYSTKFKPTLAFYESRGFVELPYHPDVISDPDAVVSMVKRFTDA